MSCNDQNGIYVIDPNGASISVNCMPQQLYVLYRHAYLSLYLVLIKQSMCILCSVHIILCMNKYDYHICLLFFMISGPNLSSTFVMLYMDGFLTQWSFHIVQEHPKQSSDEEVITF